MKKIFFLLIFSFLSLNAEYIIEKNQNLFLIKISDSSFEKDLSYLKDELTFRGFKIVYELDMAKGNKEIAKLLKKTEALYKGVNLGVCKSSFTFQMLEENYHNINYCPLSISIYNPNNKNTYISFKYYKSFKDGDKIANKINNILESIILESLD